MDCPDASFGNVGLNLEYEIPALLTCHQFSPSESIMHLPASGNDVWTQSAMCTQLVVFNRDSMSKLEIPGF
ncbi:hypothetical protein JW948_13620 [bacterium]|nr:hypothetical protein [bacterium]